MRIELIHPLLVHFPLALLLVGAALRPTSYFFRFKPLGHDILVSSWIILAFGICFAWIAILAGEFAEDIVRKQLCKPEVLEQHKHLAYTAAFLFSSWIILDLWKTWLQKKFMHPRLLMKLLTIICSLLLLGASLLLILTGGFGANLVYEQGAAVQKYCGNQIRN